MACPELGNIYSMKRDYFVANPRIWRRGGEGAGGGMVRGCRLEGWEERLEIDR